MLSKENKKKKMCHPNACIIKSNSVVFFYGIYRVQNESKILKGSCNCSEIR